MTLTATAADVEQGLAHQSAATASAVIALTLAAIIAITAAVVLTLSRTTRDDAPVSHHRGQRTIPESKPPVTRHGPAVLDWIPDTHPNRTRGHLIPWMPDDPDDTHFPLDPPAEPDYRAGDNR